MKEMHPHQLSILKKLLFSTSLRYTDMKPDPKMDNNQFDFHLDALVTQGWVAKTEAGYVLTAVGKEYANRMDTDTVKIMRQAKVGVRLCCVREGEGGLEFLIHTRQKHPFFGCQGFLGGKMQFGESVSHASARELLEETNLTGEATLVLVEHIVVWDRATDELLEDKIFFYHKVSNVQGELRANEEGFCEWVAEQDLPTYVTNPYHNMEDFFGDVAAVTNYDGHVRFSEKVLYGDRF